MTPLLNPLAAVPDALPGPPALVGLVGNLRTALVRYVHGRRAAGAARASVLAEVRDLARAAAVCEGWCDLSDFLVPDALGWAREAYAAPPAGGEGDAGAGVPGDDVRAAEAPGWAAGAGVSDPGRRPHGG